MIPKREINLMSGNIILNILQTEFGKINLFYRFEPSRIDYYNNDPLYDKTLICKHHS